MQARRGDQSVRPKLAKISSSIRRRRGVGCSGSAAAVADNAPGETLTPGEKIGVTGRDSYGRERADCRIT